MTQSNPLELAKQGDPDAIATLMNRTLQPKGMKAIASRLNDHLEVVLELDAHQVPNRQALTQFVQNGLKSLGVAAVIRSVTVIGKQANSDLPVWEDHFTLGVPLPGSVPPPPPPNRVPPAPPLTSRSLNPTVADSTGSPNRNGYPDTLNPSLVAHSPPSPIPPLKPEAPFPISQLPEDEAPPGPPEEDLDAVSAALPTDQTLPPDIANSIIAAPPQVYERIEPPQSTPTQPPIEAVEADPVPSVSSPAAFSGAAVPVSGGADLEEPIPLSQFPEVSEEEDVVFGAFDLPGSTPDWADEELPGRPDKSLTVVDAPTTPPVESAIPVPRRKSPFSPGLFVGIIAAAVTGGLAFGIIGYALLAALTRSDSPPGPPVAPITPTAPTSPTPAPVSSPADPQAAFQAAVAAGDRAVVTAQTAQSLDDWQLIVSQLEGAIATLRAVPADSANYDTAQAKLAEFEAALVPARQQANQPVPNAPPPTATTTISGTLACLEVSTTAESPAVELTNVQFEGTAAEGGAVNLTGCLTNHTNQPITNVILGYELPTPPAPEASPAPDGSPPSPAQESLVLGGVEVGSTIPFRASLTLPPDVSSLTIRSVTWSGAGSAEPQPIPLASPIQVSR